MKPFLVDVPVRINIWIRPECQRKQFEILKQARPSILFLISDGGRNEKEWEAIHKNRAIFDTEIDWECTVYKLYEEKNNGLYAMGKKMSALVWEKVDRCIFLEDDVLPSLSFFRYCKELLDRYENDPRVSAICGMNHLGVYEEATSDYFFSRQGSIWGTALWKRTILQRDPEFRYNDPYTLKLLKQRTRHNKPYWKKLNLYLQQEYVDGHVAGGEFWHDFNMYGHNQVWIVPKKNMICNIGCTEDSVHASELKKMPKGSRQMFNMKTYELDFPLKHNDYVIPDVDYEKRRNRVLGYCYPMVKFYRGVEGAIRHFIYGDFKKIIKQRVKKSKGDQCIEK